MVKIEKSIAISADDCDFARGGVDYTSTICQVQGGLGAEEAALRFSLMPIASWSMVATAVLTITAAENTTDNNPIININGYDVDDIPNFTTSPINYALTTNSHNPHIDKGSTFQKYTLPVPSIIQEIISRDKWASGAALGFNIAHGWGVGDSGSVDIAAWDHESEEEAHLRVVYNDDALPIASEAWVVDDEVTPTYFMRDVCTDETDLYILSSTTGGTEIAISKYNVDGTYVEKYDITDFKGAFDLGCNGSNFYLLDITSDRFVKFDMSGNYITSYALVGENVEGRGITADADYVWVGDSENRIFKYDLSDGSFISSCAFVDAQVLAGIRKKDSNFYAVDAHYDRIFKTDADFDVTYGWKTNIFTGCDAPAGCAIIGDVAYVLDFSDKKVYSYELPASEEEGPEWKDVTGMKINIGDDWKAVTGLKINVGDTWKNINVLKVIAE